MRWGWLACAVALGSCHARPPPSRVSSFPPSPSPAASTAPRTEPSPEVPSPAAPPASPAVSAEPLPEPPLTVASGAPRVSGGGCRSDAECVLFCPEAEGCCGSPCGCRSAILRVAASRARREFEQTCLRPPRCPAVGCRREDATGAACRAGRCVPVFGLGN